jgi:hypothetical protein
MHQEFAYARNNFMVVHEYLRERRQMLLGSSGASLNNIAIWVTYIVSCRTVQGGKEG